MTKDSLRNIFANASVIKPIAQETYLTDKDRAYEEERRVNSGLITFKRRVMGLFGDGTVKSVDELANILTELRITKDSEEAKEIIPKLYGCQIPYSGGHLHFIEAKNGLGKTAVKVEKIRPHFVYD